MTQATLDGALVKKNNEGAGRSGMAAGPPRGSRPSASSFGPPASLATKIVSLAGVGGPKAQRALVAAHVFFAATTKGRMPSAAWWTKRTQGRACAAHRPVLGGSRLFLSRSRFSYGRRPSWWDRKKHGPARETP